MRAIFNNLKPFIAYWASFAIYVLLSLFESFDFKALSVAFFAVYVISNILIGYTSKIKEILFGTILFELQLIVCAIIFSVNTTASGLKSFASAGNIFYSTFFESINHIAGFVLSIILPVLLLGLGICLTELKNKKSNG